MTRTRKPVGIGTCLVEGCDRYAYRDLCKTHLPAAKLGYLALDPSWGVATNPICAFDGCTKPATSRKPNALCIAHWQKANHPPRSAPAKRSYRPTRPVEKPPAKPRVIICVDCPTRVLAGRTDRLRCKRHADQHARYGFTWTDEVPRDLIREWRRTQCQDCAVTSCERLATSSRAKMCRTHQGDFSRKHCSLDFYLAHMAITACESCGYKGKLVTDHRHGHHPSERDMCEECIRGRLCGPCNTTFGMSGEDAQRLSNLAEYAKKHSL